MPSLYNNCATDGSWRELNWRFNGLGLEISTKSYPDRCLRRASFKTVQMNHLSICMTAKKHGNNKIIYKLDVVPTAQQVIELYNDAGLPRPTHDPQRIRAMFENSDLIVTAWDKNKLVGVSRIITDWVWCSYLADLAVSPCHKRSGIGKKLVELAREKIGEQSMLLLLSVPTAMDYYPKVGFTRENRAFIMHRIK